MPRAPSCSDPAVPSAGPGVSCCSCLRVVSGGVIWWAGVSPPVARATSVSVPPSPHGPWCAASRLLRGPRPARTPPSPAPAPVRRAGSRRGVCATPIVASSSAASVACAVPLLFGLGKSVWGRRKGVVRTYRAVARKSVRLVWKADEHRVVTAVQMMSWELSGVLPFARCAWFC